MNILVGIVFLYVFIEIVFLGSYSDGFGMTIELGNSKYLIGIFFLFISLYYFYIALKTKNKKSVEFTKCPKCKETYTYSELKDGKCPKCDIQTTDIDKYYK